MKMFLRFCEPIVLFGGINYGLKFFDYDLIARICTSATMEKVVWAVIGLSAVFRIVGMAKK